MKISLIFYNLDGGGVGRVFVALANMLSDKGLDVDLVVFKLGGILEERVSRKINLVNLGFEKIHYWFSPVVWMPNSPLVKYLKKCDSEVVHALGEGMSNLCALIKHFYNLPFRLIVSRHSLAIREEDNLLKRLVKPFFTRRTISCAERCVCVSQGLADDLIKNKMYDKSKICVIYNPVIPSDVELKMNIPVEHDWFKLHQKPIIMSVGRLAYVKGFHDLIKSFEYLRNHLKIDAYLMLIGDGPERASLEKLVENLALEKHVEFLGFVTNPYAYLSKANLFVFSSRYEGFGNTLVEALACGCKIVSTNCQYGPSEILENGKWGSLVQVGDIKGMALAMKETLSQKVQVAKLKERSAYFSEERSSSAYYELFLDYER